MTVLQMSVQAGLMVIIAGLLRVLALDKAPKRAFLVLWGLVIARMLLPFSVPSKWSVLNLARGKRETAIASGMAGIPFLQLPEAASGEPPAVSVPPLRAVWLFGMFLLSAVFVWMIVRSYRKFRFAVPFEHEAVRDWRSAHRLRRPCLILQSDQVEIPLAIGLIRPRIIFPAAMKLDPPEKIRFILAHEFFHIRRLDMLWKLLALAAVCVHWFNPLGWVMLVLLNRDLEITCDEMVITKFGGGAAVKKAYAYSLIEMEERKRGNVLAYNAFGKNATKERVEMIVRSKKAPVWAVILTIVLVTASVLTLATAAVQEDKTDIGKEGLASVHGRIGMVCGRDVIEVETLDVLQSEGDRITDWRVSSQLFRLGYYSTSVTDANGNPLSRSSLTDVETHMNTGVRPNIVTVWYDPDNLGEEAPGLIKAVAVCVESVKSTDLN